MAKNSKWTQEEMNFVAENMNKMKYKDIAKILNRSYNAVNARARRIKKGFTIIDRKKNDDRCPKCKNNENVNKVITYNPYNSAVQHAYYCKKCGIEFSQDGQIIPFAKGEGATE
jgi:predicted Zn-ribbon and HTH transcriptional regulator